MEAEQQTASDAREQYASSERRAMVLAGEIEELRTQLEAAERARKAAENELHEASDRVGDLSNANSSLATQKRKLENDIQAMQVSRPILTEVSARRLLSACRPRSVLGSCLLIHSN